MECILIEKCATAIIEKCTSERIEKCASVKKIILLLMLFAVCLLNQSHAQRCLPGMRGIQLTSGLSDDMRLKSGDGFGYHAGIAVSTYAKNAHRWVIGAEYLEMRYAYRNNLYPVSQFTGEGGYYLNFLSDRKKTFFAALGLSALAGYETVNWGERSLPDGSLLTNEDNFIYGGALTLELSAYLTDKIVLLVNGRQRMLFGGDCGRFHSQIGAGIRFMIR